MKFQLQIALKGKLPVKYEVNGELDAVKTFIKLKVIPEKFNWASVKRIDEDIVAGDVSHWVVQFDRRTHDLEMNVFAFHEVANEINLNTMRRALDDYDHKRFTQLGEGKI